MSNEKISYKEEVKNLEDDFKKGEMTEREFDLAKNEIERRKKEGFYNID